MIPRISDFLKQKTETAFGHFKRLTKAVGGKDYLMELVDKAKTEIPKRRTSGK